MACDLHRLAPRAGGAFRLGIPDLAQQRRRPLVALLHADEYPLLAELIPCDGTSVDADGFPRDDINDPIARPVQWKVAGPQQLLLVLLCGGLQLALPGIVPRGGIDNQSLVAVRVEKAFPGCLHPRESQRRGKVIVVTIRFLDTKGVAPRKAPPVREV